MVAITRRGTACNTIGDLPPVGSKAPNFRLVNKDLKNWTLKNFKGKKKILSILPSLDTPTCAKSTHVFNERIADVGGVVIIISADLPFAMSRFCSAEGLDRVVNLSMMRDKKFAKDYGVLIVDGPFEGITCRAIVVLDENDMIVHTELVKEISDEPDYDAALKAIGA